MAWALSVVFQENKAKVLVFYDISSQVTQSLPLHHVRSQDTKVFLGSEEEDRPTTWKGYYKACEVGRPSCPSLEEIV